jgi:hypothetical protein
MLMAPKSNPLKLNNLQLKTLTLFQELAKSPATSSQRDGGEVLITSLPRPHGNHFHLGSKVVMSKDATGLSNQSVWRALERKGLMRGEFPIAVILTPEGLSYDTRMAGQILIGADH